LWIAHFVAKIIGPAAEAINVVEILMQLFGQQETDYVKIFVVVRGKPAGVFQRLCRGTTRLA
jgi:hypothetical protein